MLIDLETGDLQVRNGSWGIGENTEQVAESILLAARGEFKEHPLIGAEIYKLTGGNSNLLWCSTTKEMLQSCGIPATNILLKDNQITIE